MSVGHIEQVTEWGASPCDRFLTFDYNSIQYKQSNGRWSWDVQDSCDWEQWDRQNQYYHSLHQQSVCRTAQSDSGSWVFVQGGEHAQPEYQGDFVGHGRTGEV